MEEEEIKIKKFLKNIFQENFEVERIHGGLSNKIFKCVGEKKYILRIFGKSTIDRNLETFYSKLFSKFGPKIIHSFEEGRVEEFLEGKTLNFEDLKNSELQKQLAKIMKKFHDDFSKIKKEENSNSNSISSSNSNENFLDEIENSIKKVDFSKINKIDEKILFQEVFSEFGKLKKQFENLENFHLKKKTLCHLDLLPQNMILSNSNKTSQIKLIDFEYAQITEIGFDLANFFAAFAESQISPQKNFEKIEFFKDEEIFDFLKNYFQLNLLKSEEILQIKKDLKVFYQLNELRWIAWALFRLDSEIDFDYFNYAKIRLKFFQKFSKSK